MLLCKTVEKGTDWKWFISKIIGEINTIQNGKKSSSIPKYKHPYYEITYLKFVYCRHADFNFI